MPFRLLGEAYFIGNKHATQAIGSCAIPHQKFRLGRIVTCASGQKCSLPLRSAVPCALHKGSSGNSPSNEPLLHVLDAAAGISGSYQSVHLMGKHGVTVPD
jgi:hypothetical protein